MHGCQPNSQIFHFGATELENATALRLQCKKRKNVTLCEIIIVRQGGSSSALFGLLLTRCQHCKILAHHQLWPLFSHGKCSASGLRNTVHVLHTNHTFFQTFGAGQGCPGAPETWTDGNARMQGTLKNKQNLNLLNTLKSVEQAMIHCLHFTVANGTVSHFTSEKCCSKCQSICGSGNNILSILFLPTLLTSNLFFFHLTNLVGRVKCHSLYLPRATEKLMTGCK